MIINTVVGHVYALRSDKNELFEVLEDGEKPRLRSLRTGVHLRAKDLHRDHIYLGPMPKVGDVWLWNGEGEVTVAHVEENKCYKSGVSVAFKNGPNRYLQSLAGFLQDSVFVKSGLRPYHLTSTFELAKSAAPSEWDNFAKELLKNPNMSLSLRSNGSEVLRANTAQGLVEFCKAVVQCQQST